MIGECKICNKIFKRKNAGTYCSYGCYYISKKGCIPWNKGKKELRPEVLKKMSDIRLGKKSWNSGTAKPFRLKSGYVLLLKKDHPFPEHGGYVLRSRLVMEKFLHRFLKPKEVVHHINFKRDDDRLENLQLFANQSDHKRFHWILNNPKKKLF